MPKKFTILHVSDIQFGKNHRFGRLAQSDDANDIVFDALFQRLSDDLSILERDGIKIDLVVVSGDLAEWGIKTEFEDAAAFLESLTQRLKLSKDRIVIIPGNHDINRKLCEGYFTTCEGDGEAPEAPYAVKWKHYINFVKTFFNSERIYYEKPTYWELIEVPSEKVVIAAMNSTMKETHLDNSHYGFLGENQLRWFEDKLIRYKQSGWLRIGVIHHNVERGAERDDENLRDKDDLKRILGNSLNIILHGHTHEGRLGWLTQYLPIISTGSAALNQASRPDEVGNQYQVIELAPGEITRYLRRYDPKEKKWIGDTRYSEKGDQWILSDKVTLQGVSGFSASSIAADNPPVVQITRAADPAEVQRRLGNIPRLRLKLEPHHRAVRLYDQERMVSALNKEQIVWLCADWAHGKDGFLAAVLAKYSGTPISENIFRIGCGAAATYEDILQGAEIYLGLSFQEFAAAVSTLPAVILILDDLPLATLADGSWQKLERRLRSLFDLCPELKVVAVTRQLPLDIPDAQSIKLSTLEDLDIKNYLRFHSHQNLPTSDSITLELIKGWSGALPAHLDRLLERMAYLPLNDILKEECQITVEEVTPRDLVQSIDSLRGSDDPRSRKSFKLLQVLTVLKDGETFQSIRRFYREPFHPNNVDELISKALVEAVPISLTAPELQPPGSAITVSHEAPNLLRVPKQVRDCVTQLTTDEEREEIVGTSMSVFFGSDWRQRISLRTSSKNAYVNSALVGPGNEQVVIRTLLARAIEKKNKRNTARYVEVGGNYCARLLTDDRFRDAAIASMAMLDLFREADMPVQYAQMLYYNGRALRMIGEVSPSIDVLEKSLFVGGKDLIDDFRCEIYLNLAYSYEQAGKADNSRSAAEKVAQLAKPHSSASYQAEAILATYSLKGGALREKLIEIEHKARNSGFSTAADNIALDLAGDCHDTEEALAWLRKVLRPDCDGYNRARAIVEKASVLSRAKRIAELKEDDFRILGAAYGYCYAQRFGPLLNKCHKALWLLSQRNGYTSILFRLYRFSSFIWRLREDETREVEYLRYLESVELSKLPSNEVSGLRLELIYLERRKAMLPVATI